MIRLFVAAMAALLALAAPAFAQKPGYFDNGGRTDVLSGGTRMITIDTPKGKFRVWTKRIGNNPKLKVLLLHGGPAVPHEYLEAMDSFLPGAGVEYY
jgi:proline iminopeptidase